MKELISALANGHIGGDYAIPSISNMPVGYTYPVSRKPYGVAKVRRQARKLRNKRHR